MIMVYLKMNTNHCQSIYLPNVPQYHHPETYIDKILIELLSREPYASRFDRLVYEEKLKNSNKIF